METRKRELLLPGGQFFFFFFENQVKLASKNLTTNTERTVVNYKISNLVLYIQKVECK